MTERNLKFRGVLLGNIQLFRLQLSLQVLSNRLNIHFKWDKLVPFYLAIVRRSSLREKKITRLFFKPKNLVFFFQPQMLIQLYIPSLVACFPPSYMETFTKINLIFLWWSSEWNICLVKSKHFGYDVWGYVHVDICL